MDYQNLAFLIVFVVTQVVKMAGFKDSTKWRDRVLPVIAFTAALLTRFVMGAGGQMPDLPKLPLLALGDTAMAMGMKGGINWAKALKQ